MNTHTPVSALFSLLLSSCCGTCGAWSTSSVENVSGGHVVELRSYGFGFVNNPMDRGFFIGRHTAELLYPGEAPQDLNPNAAGPLVRLPSASPLSASTRLEGTQLALTPTFVGFDVGRVSRDVIRVPANTSVVITKRTHAGTTSSQYSVHHP